MEKGDPEHSRVSKKKERKKGKSRKLQGSLAHIFTYIYAKNFIFK